MLSFEPLQTALQNRTLSAAELTAACLNAAEKKKGLNAFLTLCGEDALAAARKSDERRRAGALLSPLDGIPFAAKDNLCNANVRTSCASRMLEHFVPPYTADCVAALQSAGMILLGKTNMDEFSMGFDTATSYFGAVKNPLDETRIPGGSSGGSAAAVAASVVPAALGTDTGGSVREPAGCCGCVGLRPSYGAVSRFGMIAYASSMDTVGTLSATVADAAALLRILQRPSPRDATSAAAKPFSGCPELDPTALRIGVLAPEHPQTAAAARALQRRGAHVFPARFDALSVCADVYESIALCEATLNLGRFDGIRFGTDAPQAKTLRQMYHTVRDGGFGAVVRQRILFGAFLQLEETRGRYLAHAMRLRTKIIRQMQALLGGCDALLFPTLPGGILPCGAPQPTGNALSVLPSLCGLPALAVPFGREAGGLCGSVTLCGAAFSEGLLLSLGMLLEQEGK